MGSLFGDTAESIAKTQHLDRYPGKGCRLAEKKGKEGMKLLSLRDAGVNPTKSR
jgi:hypothetical protein